MSTILPFSQACERNKYPILEVLSPYFSTSRQLLEIGTGTAQHAIFFAEHFPQLSWQTSDLPEHHQGIIAQINNVDLSNIEQPIHLDVANKNWNTTNEYDAIYTANTLHIMPMSAVELFFQGLQHVAARNSVLMVYGPFKYNGEFTSESNSVFDQVLRSRNCGSAIRDFEQVDELAMRQGFELILDQAMPANNQCLVWRRSQHQYN